MREYKIYKTDLGYSIYKKRENGKLIYIYFLNGKEKRVSGKDYAKVFYNKEDAISALTLIKIKDKERDE